MYMYSHPPAALWGCLVSLRSASRARAARLVLAPSQMPDLLAAFGVVSAPEYLERRQGSRCSWLKWPSIGHSIVVRFVIRALHAPPAVERLLSLEQAAHGDVFRVSVPWNETRLRGPVLSVAAWLSHATVEFAHARFIAKLDDDAYINVPELERLLWEVLRVSPSPERIYLGPMSWFHWYPRIFERSGFGWSYTMAWMLGQNCRNVTAAEERCRWQGCGGCVGPFPFASGYLAVLSTPLAVDVVGSATLHDDLSRLRAADALPTRSGGAQFKVVTRVCARARASRAPRHRAFTP